MAGGQGTRFWPLSRELYPKQLLKLGDGHTLLQETVLRLDGFIKPEDVSIITNQKLFQDIKTQLAEIGGAVADKNILMEPEPKNTAAAIGLSALYLKREDNDCVMAVLPSDHVIKDKAGFHSALRKAEALAAEGYLVVFGVRPSRPETGFGYIRTGAALAGGSFKAEKFVEKPDKATAQGYLDSGDYLWNSGIFVWKAEAILNEIKLLMPPLYKCLKKNMGCAWHTGRGWRCRRGVQKDEVRIHRLRRYGKIIQGGRRPC